MFKSAYDFEPRKSDSIYPPLLRLKAIDFDKSVEVVPIGWAGGEVTPFEGTIYAVESADRVVPFVLENGAPISHLAASDLDKRKELRFFPGHFKAQIPIVIASVRAIGSDLRKLFTRGPRGMISYDHSIFRDGTHGYQFVDKREQDQVVTLIREALPILLFDKVPPAICVAVSIDGQRAKSLTSDQIDVEAKAVVHRLIHESEANKSHRNFMMHLEAQYRIAPLSLEFLTSELLDMERECLFSGASFHYPGLWNDQKFLDMLRSTYEAFHKEDRPSYELFLTTMMVALSTRVISRNSSVVGRTY